MSCHSNSLKLNARVNPGQTLSAGPVPDAPPCTVAAGSRRAAFAGNNVNVALVPWRCGGRPGRITRRALSMLLQPSQPVHTALVDLARRRRQCQRCVMHTC
jgi:hypothetical protein